MEVINVKVLIVGGGPGGSAAAITLAKAGVNCMVVEKARLPHEKICGGLYSQKTHRALHKLLTDEEYRQYIADVSCNVAHQIEFYQGHKLLVTVNCDTPMTLVDRALQDQWLFRCAERKGVLAKDGDGLSSIDFENRVATLQSGQQVHYQFLIAADGASSRVEHLLCDHDKSFPRKGDNVAGAALTVTKADLPHVDSDKLRIYFDIVPSGYSALFSFNNKMRLGIAKYKREKINLRAVLYDFARGMGLKDPESFPVEGATVPYGNVMKHPIWHDHVFFVGDAAGFVEMMSAEGICYAMMSGTDAAEAIIATSGVEAEAAKDYQRRADFYVKMVKDSRLYGWLFDNQFFCRGFYKRAPRQAGWLGYFYSRKIDEGSPLSYLHLRWNYFRKTGKLN